MPSNRHHASKARHSTPRRASVPKRKPASTTAFAACASLHDAKSIIEFLSLSYAEVGLEHGRLTGGRPLSKQAIYKAIQQPRLSDGLLETLGQLLSNRLTRMCRITVGVQMIQNSPLHVVPYLPCSTCGELYPIDRPGVCHCPRCR